MIIIGPTIPSESFYAGVKTISFHCWTLSVVFLSEASGLMTSAKAFRMCLSRSARSRAIVVKILLSRLLAHFIAVETIARSKVFQPFEAISSHVSGSASTAVKPEYAGCVILDAIDPSSGRGKDFSACVLQTIFSSLVRLC